VEPGACSEAERRANDIVFANRPVAGRFSLAAEVHGLRKATDREGTCRIVSIDGLDRSACGGTHVRAPRGGGAHPPGKLDKVRQTVRVEFLCGGRAVRRARADYESALQNSQLFSAPARPKSGPWWRPQLETAAPTTRRGASWNSTLAGLSGQGTLPGGGPGRGRRAARHAARRERQPGRTPRLAQKFTARREAVFIGHSGRPPSVLLAASADRHRRRESPQCGPRRSRRPRRWKRVAPIAPGQRGGGGGARSGSGKALT